MAYSKAKISIPSVTGNIVITATATPSVEPIVNLVDSYGVTADARISFSSGANSAQSGYCAVGATNSTGCVIPISTGDVFRIKGATWPTAKDTKLGMVGYEDAAGTAPSTAYGWYIYNGATSTGFTFSYNSTTDVATIATNTFNKPYFRFSLICSDTSSLIITKNQEISSL